MEVFEFPVTIEDEASPKLGDRLAQALDVARQVGRYGGVCVILIHPNILGHKLEFEKGFVAGIRPDAWFGSVGQFGRWWAARNKVELDVVSGRMGLTVTVTVPEAVSGLTLDVPSGWTWTVSGSSLDGVEQRGTTVILPELIGTQRLAFIRKSRGK